MSTWIDVSAVERYAAGARDEATYIEAAESIRQVARFVILRFVRHCSDETAEDIESETLAVVLAKARESYIDFDHYSCFNFVFSVARNVCSQLLRKDAKAATALSDLSVETESIIESSLTDDVSERWTEQVDLTRHIRREYERLRARFGLLGVGIDAFAWRWATVGRIGGGGLSSDAFIVATLRVLTEGSWNG